jgi:hypothetical protein
VATGTRSFGQFNIITNNSDRVDEDFENFIDYDDKTWSPMAAWLNKKENSVQKDTEEFTLFAGELIPRSATLTTTITTTDASAASVGVSSTNGIVAGTLLHVSSVGDDGATAGELLRVTAVTTTLTVTRLTTVAQIADNATVIIIGNADTETSTSGPAAFDMEPASVVGYMSILKRRIDISKTERNSAVRGAKDRLSEKLERAKMDFLLDQEHQAWFSRKTANSAHSATLNTSMGIHAQIIGDSGSTTTDAGADLTEAILGTHVGDMALYSKTSLLQCFMGKHGISETFELVAPDVRIKPEDTKWGAKANTLCVGPFTLQLMYARVFDIVGAPYDRIMFTLDINEIKNVHLREGRARLERNVHSDPSGEKESHQFRAQCGVSITTPKRHGFIYDLA